MSVAKLLSQESFKTSSVKETTEYLRNFGTASIFHAAQVFGLKLDVYYYCFEICIEKL